MVILLPQRESIVPLLMAEAAGGAPVPLEHQVIRFFIKKLSQGPQINRLKSLLHRKRAASCRLRLAGPSHSSAAWPLPLFADISGSTDEHINNINEFD